jgi:hypothetical protein
MIEELKVAGFSILFDGMCYCIVDSQNSLIIRLNSLVDVLNSIPSFLESEGIY